MQLKQELRRLPPTPLLKLLAALYIVDRPVPVYGLAELAGIGVGTSYRYARRAAVLGLAELRYSKGTLYVHLTPKGRTVASLVWKLIESM